ncbi:MAG: alpha/beta hydrolase [Firmicutes bacterium HGW-Firmicutes-12]|jgi:hypothetical protein|nr:MAG: alpha/beta hydrolase [Firmicutes bacterium HGW-Firmicutes-12]
MYMSQKKKGKTPTPRDLLKNEIAQELGLWEKISKYGWGELTAEESGRIGGIMTSRMKNKD